MNEPPILSICIPTYNQPEAIENFFASVSGQLTSDVEILIRDDSPNEDTTPIVDKYRSKIPAPLVYFKGEKSKVGGYDKALLFLTSKANGQYIWWYGDDVMVPGAIGRILETIRINPHVSFIWLNSRDISNPNDQGLNLGGDKYFTDGSEVFAINVGLLGFPSITLLKREEALPEIPNAQKFIGTTLTGYYLVLHILSQKNKKFIFLQDPCLMSNPKPPGEVRWYDSFQVHGINYFVIAQAFKRKFEGKQFRKGLADQFGRIWRAVIVERALGLNTGFAAPSPKLWKMTKLYWSYPEFYVALPLMLLPRFILRLCYLLFKGMKKPPEGNKKPSWNVIKEHSIICPDDGALLYQDQPNSYRCPNCTHVYPLENNVLRLLDKNCDFYEGVYGNQIRFLPRSERPWHIWPLWFINSGYPWQVRRHVPANSVVVELGCAAGVRYFGKRFNMIGCDLSSKSLMNVSGVYNQLLQVDVLSGIPLPDNSVDAVVSSFFWEHIRPDLKPGVLAECSRVLRPEGKIVFLYDVETNNPAIHHYKEKDPALYNRLFIEGDGHVGYQRPAENLALFQDAGFQVIEHRGMEKTWIHSPSTYSKLAHFGVCAKRLFSWTNVLGKAPWFYLYTALMRMIDTTICPLLPKDNARIDLVVLEKESS